MFQYEIERRIQRLDVFGYMVANNDYYRPMSYLNGSTSKYIDIVKEIAPESCLVRTSENSIWVECFPKNHRLPNQGHKIHLSTDYRQAETLLEIVGNYLISKRIAFKFIANETILNFVNSNLFRLGNSCKFITIYPTSLTEFEKLCPEIDNLTKEFSGPRISGDRQYAPGSIVYYRYGGFTPDFRINLYGEKEALITDDTGSKVRDIRGPSFRTAFESQVKPKFEETRASSSSQVILKDRYQVESVQTKSTKGSVYFAKDLVTGKDVVIKQARALTCASREYPHDARDFLRNEAKVLKHLEKTKLTPRFLEEFVVGEDNFIVIEKLSGKLLSYIATIPDFNIFRKDFASSIGIYLEKLGVLAANIFSGIKRIHDCGVVIKDIGPQNIFFDENTLEVKFIDFETSHVVGTDNEITTPLGTIGISLRLPSNDDPFKKDFDSLRNLLEQVLMPQSFAIHGDQKESAFKYYLNEKGFPQGLSKTLSSIGHGEFDLSTKFFITNNTADSVSIPFSTEEMRQGLCSGIIENYSFDGKGSFPSDYRLFHTNNLGLLYGLAGILQFLQIQEEVDVKELSLYRDFIDGIKKANRKDFALGLGIGLSGIAIVCAELGHQELAKELMEEVFQRRPDQVGGDFFYGSAGIAHALMKVGTITGCDYQSWVETILDELADGFLEKGENGFLSLRNEDGKSYHGLGHGSAGVALSYLNAYKLSANPKYLEIAESLIHWELAHGSEDTEYPGLTWTRSQDSELKWPYLRIGGVGIGLVALEFYRTTGQPIYLESAKKIADSIHETWTKSSGLMVGMAGFGTFLLELAKELPEGEYQREIDAIAKRISFFGWKRKGSVGFVCAEGLKFNDDLSAGSAGVGLFLSKMKNPSIKLFWDL